MPKTRINKFIFQEGNVFLRLKTTAKNLVFKKDGVNYSIEFSNQLSENMKTKFQVIFMPDLKEVPSSNTISETYSWGRLIKEESTDIDSQFCYYAIPEEFDYAAKLGPFSKDLIKLDLEIDWPNIQWGTVTN